MKKLYSIIIVLIIPLSLGAQYNTRGRRVIFDRNSVYYRIVVFDKKNLRYLVFGNNVYQTVMDKNAPDRVMFEYARMFLSALYLKKAKSDCLLLGLGGGAIAKFIRKHFNSSSLDVSEIDPLVVKVAKKYFKTPLTSGIKIYIYDGRIFIKRINKKYDIIMLDAYNSDYIPFHLMTKEFLALVKSKLKYKGIVLQNVWTSNVLLKRILTTFKSVFNYVYFAKGKISGNGVILASNTPFDLSEKNIRLGYLDFRKSRIRYHFPFLDYIRQYKKYSLRVDDNLVLTDEHAPVNFYHRRR